MVTHRVDALDPFFVALSRLGSGGFIWILLAIVAAFLWRRPSAIAWVLVALLSSELLVRALKRLTDRPRPSTTFPEPEALVRPPLDMSFPSGHAATGFAAAAVLASYERRAVLPLFAVAAAIAWSRVYVGVHYPFDVLAGAVLGLVVGSVLASAARSLPRRRAGRHDRVPATAPRSPAAGLRRSRRTPRAG